ncbi:MAG: hydroxyethylthiazole kinase [Desulfosalsimonas sp.]
MENKVVDLLGRVRRSAPLVHNITNLVVINSSANILLAVGASPVMAHSAEEAGEMAGISAALVLNIGTPDKYSLEAMILAGRAANEKGIPVVLDPVGAGATRFRSDAVKNIMSVCRISVLRGNASEVLSLASADIRTRGVESSFGISDETVSVFRGMASAENCIVAVSGQDDLITDGRRVLRVANGHSLMTRVTGMGCGLSAVTGAFCAVAGGKDLEATAAAFAFYGLCGQIAAAAHDRPGSFYTSFLDCLYSASEPEIRQGVKIREQE